jgi:CDP-diacylglycerol pyrophosphatase
MRKRTRICAAIAVFMLCLLVVMGTAWLALRPDGNALWRIVSEQCVPAARAGKAHNVCARVDLADGYALLKDRVGVAQYLLIPTARITGIESPALLLADGPNYWRAGWAGRTLVEDALGVPLPRDGIGLAINSRYGRTQDQLHIHIDCMRPDVVAALRAQRDGLGPQWTGLPVRLAGHRYRALLVDDATLAHTDPFALLADDVRARGESMGAQTLLLTGIELAGGRPGFILLSDQAGLGDLASAESLLDHGCALAAPGAFRRDGGIPRNAASDAGMNE